MKSGDYWKRRCNIETHFELQRYTYHCLLGLLVVTGLRVGEAIRLQPQDVDLSEGSSLFAAPNSGNHGLFRWPHPRGPSCGNTPSAATSSLPDAPRRDFLVSTRGKRLQKQCIGKIFRRFRGRSVSGKRGKDQARVCMISGIASRLKHCFGGIETVNKQPAACLCCPRILVTGT